MRSEISTHKKLNDVLRFGFLVKKGRIVGSWKRRFFVLTFAQIHYSETPGSKKLGSLNIRQVSNVRINTEDERDNCITIVANSRDLSFSADSEEEISSWLELIRNLIKAQQVQFK